ncbi:YhcH/YjgK/YiaL family protein [Pradoshia sp. D12]|nr:YhcH/YjgK/YiaL family protein [Pradoshia sp. D12]TPF71783.1 YhcH/YjgK/YiaL family protein [Bacillus sp. D12]
MGLISLITGNIDDLIEQKSLAENLQSKLTFLKEFDSSQYSAGRHDIDENLFFFLNEYETKEEPDCIWEAHRKYLDIHYILEGKENIAVDHINRQQIKENYDEAKDAIFLEGDVQTLIAMNPGDVMICFPKDSHKVGIITEEKQMVKKIVLKVKR